MRRAPLVLVPQHFGCLLFDRRSSRYLPFDRAGTALLDALIDGTAGSALAAWEGEERRAAEAFVGHLWSQGLLSPEGRLPASRLRPPRVPEGHLTGPLATHVEVAGSCNLSCGHCFAAPLPRPRGALDQEELDRLFAELSSIGSFRLGLTGGEPLLRADLLDVLDAATARGLHPCLTTNGLLLDERWARELGRRELVWLNVSLDGATAATNDAVRGAGTFDAVLDRLALLRRHARFTLAFTLMRPNLHEVEACARLAAEVGAHTAVFRPLYPVGAAADASAWMPSYDEYADALERLERALCPDEELAAVDPFSPTRREPSAGRVVAAPSCGAGTTVASVSVGGEVSSCSFLGPEAVVGSLRESRFVELWDHAEGLRRLRAGEDACGSCEAFEGGCRARARALSGSAHMPDPWQRAYAARRRGPGPLGNLEREVEA